MVMNMKKLIAVSIVFGLVAAAPLTFAQDQNSLVFPPDSRPFGKKYKEWSTEWWQFAYSIPVSENPLLDETGEKCVVGQHGAVWFLVGVFNTSGTAVRNECSVPAGK